MKEQKILINGIPAILLGEKSDQVFLFIHGKCGNKEEAKSFAEIVCPKGFQVVGIDLPEHGERKSDGVPLYPWTVVPELKKVIAFLYRYYSQISIRANSIGAWFAMLAFQGKDIANSLFVSPVLDMEKLVQNMMQWAAVTEEQLKTEGEISTDFGEILSWQYYTYVKEHPIVSWNTQTCILYADKDNMTERNTVEKFVTSHPCKLTVMQNGEHWFHTEEQLAFLRNWEDEMTD
ncbi:MAG: alpha/beta hydrolase [Clostridia bacterium]|nr:alpha/beta hydrolase [Clostridia bacterium]